ncbi:MAG: phytanoyl-CoA dioxygenase family protein [Rhodospirillales bacterium]|nr:phytanoyl-CoA dioxygenase family protein [Rhodospirillales bacterium]
MTASGLTDEEKRTYYRDGLVEPAWRLTNNMLTSIQQSAERLIAARSDLRPEFIPLPHVPWDDSAEAHEIAAEFLGYATDPRILDLVESVIGPDIIFWTAALFCKPPGDGMELPWHQDGQYWPIEPPATVTVWIALDAADKHNGSMRYVPGSHKVGYYKHTICDRDDVALNVMLDDPAFDPSGARNATLQPGQVSVHDVYLVHGSEANRSVRRRSGLTLRYMPSTAHYNRDIPMGVGSTRAPVEFANRPIWLVRGIDRCGKNDFTTGHSNP